ncbi:MAG: NAD(P)-binding domain-containing protein [Bacteriovoracaceae bacterium]|nr:NAD(P)-binding domain-containing protein [Bacteriovoracaceae bacterium]
MYKMIIIGAGPSGISLAAELISDGVPSDQILVLEKAEEKSFIMRTLYPAQKMVTANFKGLNPVANGVMKFYDCYKDDALTVLDETIKKYNINVNFKSEALRVEKKEDRFVVTSKSGTFESELVAIGIGIFGRPNKPDYKIPPALIKKCQYDITSTNIENEKVCVVGGGDSAAEYVKHLVDENNNLFLSSREVDLSYMNPQNRDDIIEMDKAQKMKLLAGSNIVSLEETDEGQIRVNLKEFDPEHVVVDRMVFALGGTTPSNFLKVMGIDLDNDRPKIDDHFESEQVPGLFVVGDLAVKKNGGAIIVAFNTSEAAKNRIMQKYVKN